MKATINGKRYDTIRCELLGTIKHYTPNGNLSGYTKLLRASNGTYLVWTDSNGEDIHMMSFLCEWHSDELTIDSFYLTDEQEARCASLGLIEIVD